MLVRTRSIVVAGVLAVGAALVVTSPSTAANTTAPAKAAQHARTAWAPAGSATIHPGVMMYTDGAQCTANFVYTDGVGSTFVGYAAHCAGTGAATDTNGCDSGSLPLGTPVTFNEGGSLVSDGTQVGTGKLVYSSWITMQKNGETNPDVCAYNDLALVEVDPAYVADVNPSIPFWGGPVGINATGTQAGDQVYTYGNSSLRAGVSALSPHTGVSVGDDGNGWSHGLYTVSPGIPGDSGSAFLDANGNALGVLSTIEIAPLPAANNIGDVNKELNYAKANSGLSGLALVPGTEPFSPVL
ncbi:MAG: hypothetical protein WBV37_17610 [Nocardioidaceae bacterium]